jgi:hypothetical protein
MLAGLTGLRGDLIRPRWQPLPPNQPPAGTNWAAVGVMERMPLDYTFEKFVTDPSSDSDTFTLQRQERLEVMASFYGPSAGGYAQIVRDGIYLSQNREALALYAFD